MMKVFVVGGVGIGAEIIDALLAESGHAVELAGFYDDDQRLRRNGPENVAYLGTLGDLVDNPPAEARYILGLDDNPARLRAAQALGQTELEPFSFQHPTAVVSAQAVVEPGAYIGAYSFVGPRVTIGKHAIINVSASVGFAAQIAELAQICPGARISRCCNIGGAAFIGSNAIISPSVTIGARARVAAGSFVFRNVPPDRMAMGIPGRIVDE